MKNKRKAIKNGSIVTLNNEASADITIIREIGRSSTCIVYDVSLECDSTIKYGILKEFYPMDSESVCYDIYRKENMLIGVDGDIDEFNSKKEKFHSGCLKQIEFYKQLNNAENSVIQEIYYGGCTEYCLVFCESGQRYDKINDNNILDILTTAKATAEAVKCYHSSGYLHLDIQPENIFVISDTEKSVILLDFDSIIDDNHMQKIKTRSSKYAAPELIKNSKGEINYSADLFSITAVIFARIFGRSITAQERMGSVPVGIPTHSGLFKNADENIFQALKELFDKFLKKPSSSRCQNTEEFINMLDELISLAMPVKNKPEASLLSYTDNFVGRYDVFERIDLYFSNGQNYVFLQGAEGMGKTAAAIKYADNLSTNTFFTSYAGDMLSTVAALQLTDFTLNDTYGKLKTQEEIYEEKLNYLLQCNGGIMIIDNFDISDISPFSDCEEMINEEAFKNICNMDIRLIFTTRSRFDTNCIDIERLDNDILINLIKNIHPGLEKTADKKLNSIINKLDGNTFAVKLAAKIMRQKNISADHFYKVISDSDDKRSKNKKRSESSSASEKLYKYVQSLFDMCAMTEFEKSIMSNMSLLPSDGMKLKMFLKLNGCENADTINSLINTGWINYDNKTGIINLNNTVRNFMLNEFIPDEDKNGDFINAVLDELQKEPNLSLIKTAAAAAENTVSDNSAKMRLFDAIGDYYGNLPDLKNQLKFYELAMKIRKKEFAANQTGIADAYLKISSVLIRLKKYFNALEYYKRALKIYKELSLTDQTDLAELYNNIAYVYGKRKKYQNAMDYYEKALKIRTEENPKNSHAIAILYNNMGYTYGESEKFNEELKYCQKAAEIQEKETPVNYTGLAASYNNISSAYISLGEYEKALDYYEKILKIIMNEAAPDEQAAARIYNNIAYVYANSENYVMVLEYYKKALEIQQKILPPNHPIMAILYDNIGCAYYNLENYDKSMQYYKKALKIQEKRLPPDHPDFIMLYDYIASIYKNLNNYDKALEYYRKELEITASKPSFENKLFKIMVREKINEIKNIIKC